MNVHRHVYIHVYRHVYRYLYAHAYSHVYRHAHTRLYRHAPAHLYKHVCRRGPLEGHIYFILVPDPWEIVDIDIVWPRCDQRS